jgi:hypothetical protein
MLQGAQRWIVHHCNEAGRKMVPLGQGPGTDNYDLADYCHLRTNALAK